MIVRKIDGILSRIPLLNVLSSKKIIRNNILNRLGAQPFRIWLAEKRYRLRRKHLSEDILSNLDVLASDGVVVIPDFLPCDQFERLENECRVALDKEERSVIRPDGPNLYTNISSRNLDKYSEIMSVFRNEKIERLFRAAERRDLKLEDIVTLMSDLVQGEDNGIEDPETILHEDIFFNTHKAWLYITDVELPNAPFVYVKGSCNNHRVQRMKKSYQYSLKKDSVHSRRIDEKEMKELKLKESIFVAKKNTFVMANTLGFHRRLRGEPGNHRIALDFSARFNPFI